MDRGQIFGKLVFNAFRYRLLKYSGRPFRLEAISLEITHRCICRCCMCNIWKIPKQVPDLPLSTWTNLLSSMELRGLRELDITGGEPFLREDLEEFLSTICRFKNNFFPELKTIAITTNGILTDRILKVTGEIAGRLQEKDVDLVLACGLDGVGELHDHIRNFKGAWKKLNSTIIGLNNLRKTHPNLILGIKTTIIPANVHELDRIGSFAKDHGLFTIISPCIITANRFGNVDLKEKLKFTQEDTQAIIRFYEGPSFAWNGHRQTMLQYLRTGKLKKPCSAGFNTVFVRHNGEVFPCPLVPNALGNIKNATLGACLSNLTAVQFRKNIGKSSECKICTEPGLERIAWPFEGLFCLRSLFQMKSKDFNHFVRHMGFNKYL